MNMEKPKPIYITVGDKKIGAAYANRPPIKKKPYWSWKMRFVGSGGSERNISLGRLPISEVSDKMIEQLEQRELIRGTYDVDQVDTIGNLLRAWYENEVKPSERSERTKALYLSSAKSIVEIADKIALSALSGTRITIIRAVLKKRYQSTTVHTKLQSLQFAISWGRKMGIPIPDFEFKNPRGKPKESYTPNDQEVLAVVSKCGNLEDFELGIATLIAWKTGARVGEVYNLRRSDFVERDGYAQVRLDGKTGERWTTIKWDNWLFLRYLIVDFPEQLFAGKLPSTASNQLGQKSEALGNRFTFQPLRRLRAKTLIENGLPIKRYQEEMGHSYKTAMEHYVRYRPEEVLDML